MICDYCNCCPNCCGCYQLNPIDDQYIESVIQSLGFIRHPDRPGYWIEPFTQISVRHRNLRRWAQEASDLKKRIIDEIGHLIGKKSGFRNNPQLSYLGQCDNLLKNGFESHWERMMQQRIPISADKVKRECNLSQLLDPDEDLMDFIAGDPTSQFFESYWGQQRCIFIQTHGFEFIFVEP